MATETNLGEQSRMPVSLPLLDYVDDLYSIERTQPFKGYKILAVQHLLGSTTPFFAKLEKGGVRPSDIHIVGKAYSSHPLVINQLIQKGYRLDMDAVFDCMPDQPYDTILEKHIIDTCSTLLNEKQKNQRGLIIDDGGKAIRLLHQVYPNITKQFACIEQTSRGARIINSLQLACPVINVARSDAKTVVESPAIAKAMVSEFLTLLTLWGDEGAFHLSGRKLLLLGYGFIGENVARELRSHGFEIVVYDVDKNKLQIAYTQGFSPIEDRRAAYEAIHIVVGSTGISVMKDEEFEMLKPGTLMVNMASTDTEFSAWKLRPRGTIIHQHIITSDTVFLKNRMPLPWRSLYRVPLSGTYIYLANGGFPCDFTGKINPVPLKDIQLTSALLLGAAVQATQETEPKFIDLDAKLQKNVISQYAGEKSQ